MGEMRNAKAKLLAPLAIQVRLELERVGKRLHAQPITKEDEESIDRLKKLATAIHEYPNWPFDAATVRKVLIIYVVPFALAIATKLAVEYIKN